MIVCAPSLLRYYIVMTVFLLLNDNFLMFFDKKLLTDIKLGVILYLTINDK